MEDRYLLAGMLAFGVLLGFAVTAVSTPSAVTLERPVDRNVISVTGAGEVDEEPNRVVISVGVEVTRGTAEEARAENANRTSRVVAALEELGLPEDQIETERYAIYPQRNYDGEGAPRVTGYQAVNTIRVTSNDTSIAAAVIDTAVGNGANDVDTVSFTLTEEARQAAREEAIAKAIDDAEAEASAAAERSGVELEEPVRIELGGTGFQPYRAQEAIAAPTPTPSPGGGPTPIRPGKVTVTATVDVTYGYE